MGWLSCMVVLLWPLLFDAHLAEHQRGGGWVGGCTASCSVILTLVPSAHSPVWHMPCCRGVVCLVELLDGRVQKGDRITSAATGALVCGGGRVGVLGKHVCGGVFVAGGVERGLVFVLQYAKFNERHSAQTMHAGTNYEVLEVGLQAPVPHPTGELLTGQVRWAAHPVVCLWFCRRLACEEGAQPHLQSSMPSTPRQTRKHPPLPRWATCW